MPAEDGSLPSNVRSTGGRWAIPKKFWRSLSFPIQTKPTRIRVRSVVEEYSPPKNLSCEESDEVHAEQQKLVHLTPVESTEKYFSEEKENLATGGSVVDPSYYWWERQIDSGCAGSTTPCLCFAPRLPTLTETPKPNPSNAYSFLQHNITSRLHEEIEVTETHHVKVRLPPTHPRISSAPFRELALQLSSSSVSELTLRSCAAEPAEQRRMAYYAVGQHHRKTVQGNRRCYFSGKLIMNQPFYAGALEQGLRTLVVFCLPSALNLGTEETIPKRRSGLSSLSRISDDLSLNIEDDLDVHWNVDKDKLLALLPEANLSLLESIHRSYPGQFETLPMQIRGPSCWRLYSKFCFFSGLPIAPNELHYKVKDVVADVVYGEEVALSHEVMKACSDAAELLTVPSTVVLAYLRQHYPQQCSKLEERVFRRSSWVRVESLTMQE